MTTQEMQAAIDKLTAEERGAQNKPAQTLSLKVGQGRRQRLRPADASRSRCTAHSGIGCSAAAPEIKAFLVAKRWQAIGQVTVRAIRPR